MESLTKENFWNEAQKKYPKAMESFCKWVDEYKKSVHWESLFPVTERRLLDGYKYHHLPLAMLCRK